MINYYYIYRIEGDNKIVNYSEIKNYFNSHNYLIFCTLSPGGEFKYLAWIRPALSIPALNNHLEIIQYLIENSIILDFCDNEKYIAVLIFVIHICFKQYLKEFAIL